MGFVDIPGFLFCDDEVNIDIGVDEVAIGGPPHGALDAHQTMLLGQR